MLIYIFYYLSLIDKISKFPIFLRELVETLDLGFLVCAFCETKMPDSDSDSDFIQTDLILKGPLFYRISVGLPTLPLLASNLGCFLRVPLLATIVFQVFVVTRHTAQTVFRHSETFAQKFFHVAKESPLWLV